ncbi:CinA family protein [Nocardioides sp.]|uniref:CinA family protein n=1 Tax=Nocardioides sp. TaxID=35761 RepID=UPI001A24CF97|nr:CinA family protein [Nocardioides sp.]MBJ7358034.1 CinA family protein [Nocardioides sp.]
MTAGRTTKDPKRDALREAAVVHGLLLEGEQTVATAESLTGGRLGMLLTETPGSSATFVGGVVAYATRLKVSLLGVPESLVEAHGVVSAECARSMAQGARRLMGATYGLSTTGVAGPETQEGKPAGTVFVAVAGPDDESVVALELAGSRFEIRDRTCAEALSALAAILRGKKPTLG